VGICEQEIVKLSPVQCEILIEIHRMLEIVGAGNEYHEILGSWGDTLPESAILRQLREANQNATSASITSTQV
jgi:hypothetical protein